MKKHLCFWVVMLVLSGIVHQPIYAVSQDADPVRLYLSGVKMLGEEKHGNLTIVPVVSSARDSGADVKTLDEALKSGSLSVTEASESGNVNRLHVVNKSKSFVFIMAGEILAGAKQDRILQSDVLIPPESGKVTVEAFCVEHGRWQYSSKGFYSMGQSANIGTRGAARQYRDQSQVWQKVAETNKAMAATAPTGSLAKSFDSPKYAAQKDEYKAKFKEITSRYPEMTGAIVLIKGKVLAADLFSNHRIFQNLWEKLLDSYIMEAISAEGIEVKSDFTSAVSFMEAARKATVKYVKTPGAGFNIDLASATITGSGVIKGDIPMHLDIFPIIEGDAGSKMRQDFQRNYRQRRGGNAP
ncbi:MAG: DUF6569 family protein [Syntrophus sp. (in: bacteria)]